MTRLLRNAQRPIWLMLAAFALTGEAPPGWVTVHVTLQAPVLSGFAAVQPGTDVTITALEQGVLTTLTVAPGESVRPGQTIAHLGGPEIAAALEEAQGASNAASAILAAELSKFADHLSTQAAVAQASANAQAAKAKLTALQTTTLLQSPVAGQIQSLAAGPGAALLPGQAVAVVQPDSGAWVRAVLYGPQATTLVPGTAARFIPADGQPAESVTLRGVLNKQADGGLVLAFSGLALQQNEAGTLSLALPPRQVLLVPSEALVLDDGRWWVMLHGAKGDRAVQVVPGEAEGAQTPILSGLAAGDQVVVQDAALLYHRDIAALYQPPD
ncbi:efflux RND transporter periplasmic adaptor subunit [Acidocella facilis]|uniref:efflux RND transporter periplasmic adaptor subunit n=1 Tax=Acidocella facilis TaxID=525 RepID=UPI001F261EDE|nr:efflux RND transporter periplasmic adaptor subunit [Acidocella facilis]